MPQDLELRQWDIGGDLDWIQTVVPLVTNITHRVANCRKTREVCDEWFYLLDRCCYYNALLTAFYFYEAQLPVHWEILQIHGTGGRDCEPESIASFSKLTSGSCYTWKKIYNGKENYFCWSDLRWMKECFSITSNILQQGPRKQISWRKCALTKHLRSFIGVDWCGHLQAYCNFGHVLKDLVGKPIELGTNCAHIFN